MVQRIVIIAIVIAAFVLGSLSGDQLLRRVCSAKSLKKFKQTPEYRNYRISFCGGLFFALFLLLALVFGLMGYISLKGLLILCVFGICGAALMLLAWKQANGALERMGLLESQQNRKSSAGTAAPRPQSGKKKSGSKQKK